MAFNDNKGFELLSKWLAINNSFDVGFKEFIGVDSDTSTELAALLNKIIYGARRKKIPTKAQLKKEFMRIVARYNGMFKVSQLHTIMMVPYITLGNEVIDKISRDLGEVIAYDLVECEGGIHQDLKWKVWLVGDK